MVSKLRDPRASLSRLNVQNFPHRSPWDIIASTMAEARYSLVDTAYPSHSQTPVEVRRKPLASSVPSEELLFSSLGNAGYSHGTTSSIDDATSLHLRHLPSSYDIPLGHSHSATLPKLDQNHSPWRPGFWVRFPVLGIMALLMTVLCK
jgi:hypothetical protein